MSHNCAVRLPLRLPTIALMFCLAWCVVANVVKAEEMPYLIQPGDVLQVSVWKEPDLQAELLVRSDGRVSFPLAGDLAVSDQSVEQVAVSISERIERYVPKPLVTVVVKRSDGNRIYVVGKVNRAGEFSFNRPVDVMQALSLAGGGTPYAALSNIRILRRENGRQIAIRFDYTDIENGKSLDKNILLKSGDTVVVP